MFVMGPLTPRAEMRSTQGHPGQPGSVAVVGRRLLRRADPDRPIRVVLYVRGFPPRETGGPVEVAAHLSSGLLACDGLHLTLVVQTDSTEPEIRDALGRPHNLDVIRLPYFPTVRELSGLRRAARAFASADVIHFNEFPFRHMPLVVLAKARGVPLVFSMHGLVSREIHDFLGPSYPLILGDGRGSTRVRIPPVARFALLSAYRSLSRMWTAVVVPSEALKRQATSLERLAPSRISVIPHGVEALEGTKPQDARRAGPPRLLFVGKLEAVKGPDLLLEALGCLRATGIQAETSLVGAGSMEATLRDQATRLGLERIAFLGVRRGVELQSLYAACDIVVVPSREESLSLVVLEAMAAGRPILATNVGGIPEIVHEPRNALLVPPDPEALAAGLAQLIGRPGLRASMAEANREDARRRSWPSTVERYLELYSRLLPEARVAAGSSV